MAGVYDIDNERREVYFRQGVRNGRPLLTKAPFDLVEVNGEWYVEPNYIGNDLSKFVQDDIEDYATIALGRQETYVNPQIEVMEIHEVGGQPKDETADGTWKACHAFGVL